MSLQLLERNPLIWKGRDYIATSHEKITTGHHELDKALNGGLPNAGAISLATNYNGIGEITLFSNVLKQQQKTRKLTVFIRPPANINGPWLIQEKLDPKLVYQVNSGSEENTLWAAEQCLRSQACSVVMTWVSNITHKQARRLQVAAAQHQTLLILYRAALPQHQVMPMNVDLSMQCNDIQPVIHIHKQVGGWARHNIPINLGHIPSNHIITQLMQKGRELTIQPLDLVR